MKLFVLVAGLTALLSPVAAEAECSSLSPWVQSLKDDVTDPVSFCGFWTQTKRSSSPFTDLNHKRITRLCHCIADDPSLVGEYPEPTRTHLGKFECSPSDESVEALKEEVADPYTFCNFWGVSSGRKHSPFKYLHKKRLDKICICAAQLPGLFDGSGSTSTSSSSSTESATSTPESSSATSTDATTTTDTTSTPATSTPDTTSFTRFTSSSTTPVYTITPIFQNNTTASMTTMTVN